MPWMATANPSFACPVTSPGEKALLLSLQRQALQYFVDNQLPTTGLVLDRQRNFGALLSDGLYSTAATGMGLIAIALASASPYRLLAHAEAVARIQRALTTALETLPETAGILPHFVDAASGAPTGCDLRSTIDSAWLFAGALWSAAFLRNATLEQLANKLVGRVDWHHWTAANGLIRHGADRQLRPLPSCWDRLNGETVFMYILAAGARDARAWPAAGWQHLGMFVGEAGGLRFGSADLGLFVFQYGLDLLDLGSWQLPQGCDLADDAAVAAEANANVCRAAAREFATYRRFWGLSAGDGPGHAGSDTYRCYAPGQPLDGTAHVSATLPSLVHRPALVWENLHQAQWERGLPLRGRYGFSNVNLDQHWVGRDMVGIDAGAIVLALDNALCNNRVRSTFHGIEAVAHGLERIGCTIVPTEKRLAA